MVQKSRILVPHIKYSAYTDIYIKKRQAQEKEEEKKTRRSLGHIWNSDDMS
jgi:hypothetical protein